MNIGPVKVFTNEKTGEKKKFAKYKGKWIPLEEAAEKSIAEAESGMSALKVGAGKSVDDLVTGVQQLFGGEGRSQEERDAYARLKEASPKATAVGEFAGDLAQIAIPGAAATRGVQAAGYLKNSPFLAATLTDILASAGTGYLGTPEDATRGEKATSEALWSLGGSALGKFLAGSRISDDARKLMDEGVYLTPGQATDSQTIQAIENVMDVSPFTARGTKQARARGQQEFREKVMNTVGEELGVDVSGTATGREAFKILDDAYRKGFDEAFENVKHIPATVPGIMTAKAEDVLSKFGKPGKRALNSIKAEIKLGSQAIKDGASAKEVANIFDKALRDTAKMHGRKNPGIRQAINEIRQTFYRTLPEDVAQRLAVLDEVTPDLKTVQKAVAKANKTGRDGGFSPQEVLTASGQVGGERAVARGESPLFDLLNAGQKTVGRKEGGQPLEWFRRLAAGVPSPPAMQTAGDLLMGSTKAHRAVKDLPKMLLEAANPSGVVPAATQDEEDALLALIKSLRQSS